MNIKITKKKIIPSLVLGAGLAVGFIANTHTAQAATVNRPKTYTVKKGDCFWKIARKYKMSVKHLEAINGMNDYSIIYPKDKLKLKGKEKPVVQETSHVAVSYQEPEQTPVQEQAPVVQSEPEVATVQAAATSSAKEWIAQRESGGSYNAQNGRYIGKFQLDSAYLNGDYSPANQERVAQKYVNERYGGSWDNAKAFWVAHGWY